jgi:hypothetical protein
LGIRPTLADCIARAASCCVRALLRLVFIDMHLIWYSTMSLRRDLAWEIVIAGTAQHRGDLAER